MEHGAVIKTDPVFAPQGIYSLLSYSDKKVVKEECQGSMKVPL